MPDQLKQRLLHLGLYAACKIGKIGKAGFEIILPKAGGLMIIDPFMIDQALSINKIENRTIGRI
ncbi:MAG: hypothetical protein A3G29_03450 [Burkholderiales bacterium RIFCSPLOWO2_12_FULL_64_99]|nr:MAG: hypothetical protein A3E52_11410 [Burkholderiales bacterium RIFCSPHIGHO2_12_FULL_63_20]OGB64537.1 MAG: hypothetical protein A3G29_03450 [Burkholderiales bacterium RIFCSPLOWO2_12_FULL_64_99]